MKKEDIDNLRSALGTLPSQKPEKNYEYKNALETGYVNMTDYPENIMKNIVVAATSTWGNGNIGSNNGSCDKWNKLTPRNRYIVALSAITGNTLPLALENVCFQFEFNGFPRHTFDQWCRTRLAAHQSIGCRDNCVLPGTKVKLKNYFLDIEDIQVGDKVLTHTCKFKKVNYTFKNKYEGDIINIKLFGSFENIKLTPEHPVYAIKHENLRDGRKNGSRIIYDINKASWYLSKDLKNGDCVIEAIDNFETKKIEFDLDNYYKEVYFSNQFGLSNIVDHNIKHGVKIGKIEFDKNWAFLLGWYIAEGCMFYFKNKTHASKEKDVNGIMLCVGPSDLERGYIDEIIKCVKNINKDINIKLTIKESKSPVKLPQGGCCINPKPIHHIIIKNRQIARFIYEQFGAYSRYKKIPDWFLYLDKDILKSFIEGYSKGDGQYDENGFSTVGSVNKNLMLIVSRILDKININHSGNNYGPNFGISRSCTDKYNRGMRFKRIDNYRFHLIKSIKIENYKGYVYNLEVDDDNSYTLSNMTIHNCKLDAPFILYPELYNEIQKNEELRIKFESWVKTTKDLYEDILNVNGVGSYQSARSVLPMSYNHSWTTSIDLLSLKAQLDRRLLACEEAPIVLLAWKIREQIEKVSPFIANYLRPVCDKVRKCVYHGGAEGLTKYFSNLFAGCGRWKDEVEYAEFNFSCSNYEELSKYVNIIKANEWIEYTENDYDKLDNIDKTMFEY